MELDLMLNHPPYSPGFHLYPTTFIPKFQQGPTEYIICFWLESWKPTWLHRPKIRYKPESFYAGGISRPQATGKCVRVQGEYVEK
jgi:hypothetical protein